MKLIFLAAAATIAVPALAQTGANPTTSDMQAPAGQGMQSSMPGQSGGTTGADATAGGGMSGGSMSGGGSMAGGGAMAGGSMAAGGTVQMGGMMGGAGVAPQPIGAPTPVDPNPPVCKKGQFDGCRNGPGSTHSREVRGRS